VCDTIQNVYYIKIVLLDYQRLDFHSIRLTDSVVFLSDATTLVEYPLADVIYAVEYE
jgi:hypothetical protein